MTKVWVYKRKGIKGWWVGWYESGGRKAKVLPTKSLAEHYCRIKYAQLNSEVFTGTVSLDWRQLKDGRGHILPRYYEIHFILFLFHNPVCFKYALKLVSYNPFENGIDSFVRHSFAF